MRKKSHISLAGQIMDSMELDNVFDYRLPFYVGSIWPDCRPSFVTTPHKFDITFDDIERKISKFIANYDKDKGMNMRRCAGLGVIIHYIADYFTYPHNAHYPGTLKDHCSYEEDLKHRMRSFVHNRYESGEMQYDERMLPTIHSLQELLDYVKEKHEYYVHDRGNVNLDCAYSYIVCLAVMYSLLQLAVNPA